MHPWRRRTLIICAAQFLTSLGFTIVMPFLPLFMQELNTSFPIDITLWVGLVMGAQGLTMMMVSPIWGMVGDRFGRRLMILRATVVGGLVMTSMAFVASVEQLFVLRLAQGLTTGVVSASSSYISSDVPSGFRGQALGWVSTARLTGFAAGPVVGGIVSDLLGYRASFWLNGGFMIASGILVLFLLPEQRAANPVKGLRTPFVRLFNLLQRPNVASLYSFVFLTHLAVTFITPFASLYLTQLNRSFGEFEVPIATAAGTVFGLHAVTGALGALTLGPLTDRYGGRLVLLSCAVVSALLFLPQGFTTHLWQLTLLYSAVGFAMGGIYPAVGALLAGVSADGQQGAVFGLENSVRAAARTAAPALSAAVAWQLGLSAVYVATGVVFALLAVVAAARRGLGPPGRF